MHIEEEFEKLLNVAIGLVETQFAEADIFIDGSLSPNGYTGLGFCSGYILGCAHGVSAGFGSFTETKRVEFAKLVFERFYSAEDAIGLLEKTKQANDGGSNVANGYQAALSDVELFSTPMQINQPTRLSKFLEINADGGVSAMLGGLHHILGFQYFAADKGLNIENTSSEGLTGSPFFAGYLIGAVEALAGISLNSEDDKEHEVLSNVINEAFYEVYGEGHALSVLGRTIDLLERDEKGVFVGRMVGSEEVAEYKSQKLKGTYENFKPSGLIGLLINS